MRPGVGTPSGNVGGSNGRRVEDAAGGRPAVGGVDAPEGDTAAEGVVGRSSAPLGGGAPPASGGLAGGIRNCGRFNGGSGR